MLKDIGVKYVLVGHSERRYCSNSCVMTIIPYNRTLFKEDDKVINRKVKKVEGTKEPTYCL